MLELFNPMHIIFYIFSAVAVCSAIAVITAHNPVRSVLSLVVTFFSMAGIWMMLDAEFLSLILVLVYVGAVMTLFLFVVMMLNVDTESKSSSFIRYWPFALILVLLIIGLTIAALRPVSLGLPQMMPVQVDSNVSNLQALGAVLYTDYAYPFEIAGVILLAAIIAAITLAHRGPVHRKVQDPRKQIDVRPEDRVRLVKMPATPRKPS